MLKTDQGTWDTAIKLTKKLVIQVPSLLQFAGLFMKFVMCENIFFSFKSVPYSVNCKIYLLACLFHCVFISFKISKEIWESWVTNKKDLSHSCGQNLLPILKLKTKPQYLWWYKSSPFSTLFRQMVELKNWWLLLYALDCLLMWIQAYINVCVYAQLCICLCVFSYRCVAT